MKWFPDVFVRKMQPVSHLIKEMKSTGKLRKHQVISCSSSATAKGKQHSKFSEHLKFYEVEEKCVENRSNAQISDSQKLYIYIAHIMSHLPMTL